MQINEQEDELLNKYLLLFQACLKKNSSENKIKMKEMRVVSAAASDNSCLLKLQTKAESRWWLCHRHYEFK